MNYKIGVFKIEYRTVKKEKRTITKKVLCVIEERFTDNLSKTFLELKKIYKDWHYYFCEVSAKENYYFFPSRQSKARILTNERGIEQWELL